ncbi:MAG: FUN14 domain-containing protein [Thiolinea sp.]
MNNPYVDVPPTLQPASNTAPSYAQQNQWVPVEPGDLDGLPGTDTIGALNGAPGELDSLSSTFLIGNVGAPFVIGLAVGYFAKKVMKIALFLAGGAIVLLFVSEYYGLTAVSDSNLQGAADAATRMARDSGGFLMDRLSRISTKGVSAVGGFLVGLKFG